MPNKYEHNTRDMFTYSHEHLSLLCFLTGFQVCETMMSQRTKRQYRHFFIYVSPPLSGNTANLRLFQESCKGLSRKLNYPIDNFIIVDN